MENCRDNWVFECPGPRGHRTYRCRKTGKVAIDFGGPDSFPGRSRATIWWLDTGRPIEQLPGKQGEELSWVAYSTTGLRFWMTEEDALSLRRALGMRMVYPDGSREELKAAVLDWAEKNWKSCDISTGAYASLAAMLAGGQAPAMPAKAAEPPQRGGGWSTPASGRCGGSTMASDSITLRQLELELVRLGACDWACIWVRGLAEATPLESARVAWDSCKYGEWLLWIATKYWEREGVPPAAGRIAARLLPLVLDEVDMPVDFRAAIEDAKAGGHPIPYAVERWWMANNSLSLSLLLAVRSLLDFNAGARYARVVKLRDAVHWFESGNPWGTPPPGIADIVREEVPYEEIERLVLKAAADRGLVVNEGAAPDPSAEEGSVRVDD